ncbi:MAG: ribosomal protein S18-alanine N-acetyltransferase [Syntrophobacteraceae bacterium]|nr:ribosomal protein S18-alanine N-acetyltransferase [Syntrophobacteraceae bacterium]
MAIERDSQPEPWTTRSFMEEIVRGSLFVARAAPGDASACGSGADIAGYICFWCVAGEVQILNIAVPKHLRRKGIARKLLDFAICTGREKKAGVVTLEVRQSNTAARRLYESLGFRITGERPGYYGAQSGESAILMELDIP